MGQAADPARQEHELTKQALADRVQRFEERVREELDWRARLRRNRGKVLATAAGAALLIAALVVVRSRLRDRDGKETPATLDDVADELRRIVKQLERRGGEAPLWQRLVVRSAMAAATAGGAYAARRMMQGAEAQQETSDSARTG